jgi:hypothetical protein
MGPRKKINHGLQDQDMTGREQWGKGLVSGYWNPFCPTVAFLYSGKSEPVINTGGGYPE